MENFNNLISAEELKDLIADPHVRLLDCSWYLPSAKRSQKQEFYERHILGAQFFDIDEVCDQHSALPHMLPSPDQFAAQVGALGVSNSSLVITYDTHGLFSAARVWWMFKVFGHTNVKVLNGGLPCWVKLGGAIDVGNKTSVLGDFRACLNPAMVTDKQQVLENIKSREALLVDARSAGRFDGELPEPRPELPSGHILGSRSLPFTELIEDGQLKPQRKLLNAFKNVGVSKQTKVITSCGSGVTAAILTLALAECGFGLQQLYDGAWTEWASSELHA